MTGTSRRCNCKVDKYKTVRALYGHLRSKAQGGGGNFHMIAWKALAERVALAAGQLLVYSRSVDANADLRRDRDTHWACFANAAAAFEPQYATQCRAEFDLLAGGA